MKKNIIILLFFPLIIFSQERNILKGNVFDGITFFPLEVANIYNFNTKKFSFSDKEGNFTILAKIYDTIIISKSIYKESLIVVTKEFLSANSFEIPLYYKPIILKEVNVFALNATYEGFKRDFLNVSMSDFYKIMSGTNMTKQDLINAEFLNRKGPNLLRSTAAASPITALYNKYSKKKKLERQYFELVENQEEVDKLHLKYNRELVTNLTGLEGRLLLDFMTYCRFGYYDLIRWTPEFIITQIKKKYADYEYYKAIKDDY